MPAGGSYDSSSYSLGVNVTSTFLASNSILGAYLSSMWCIKPLRSIPNFGAKHGRIS